MLESIHTREGFFEFDRHLHLEFVFGGLLHFTTRTERFWLGLDGGSDSLFINGFRLAGAEKHALDLRTLSFGAGGMLRGATQIVIPSVCTLGDRVSSG